MTKREKDEPPTTRRADEDSSAPSAAVEREPVRKAGLVVGSPDGRPDDLSDIPDAVILELRPRRKANDMLIARIKGMPSKPDDGSMGGNPNAADGAVGEQEQKR